MTTDDTRRSFDRGTERDTENPKKLCNMACSGGLMVVRLKYGRLLGNRDTQCSLPEARHV